MPKIPVWGWIAIAIAAILLLRPRVALGQGQVQVGGSLSQVDMGSHQVQKSEGSPGTVTINWTGTTKNFSGVGIAWIYRLRFTINRASDNFSIIPGVFGQETSAFGVPKTSSTSITIPAGAPLGLYNITAFLQANPSDASGNPDTSSFQDIPGAVLTHTNAINIVAAAGAAVPAGSIGAVDVSQAMVRAAQSFLQ